MDISLRVAGTRQSVSGEGRNAMEIRTVKDKEPELKLKKQAEVMVHKNAPVAAEKNPRIIFQKKSSTDVLGIRNRNELVKDVGKNSGQRVDQRHDTDSEQRKSQDKQHRLYMQELMVRAAVKERSVAKRDGRQKLTEDTRRKKESQQGQRKDRNSGGEGFRPQMEHRTDKSIMTNEQAKESYQRKMKIRSLSGNVRTHLEKAGVVPRGANGSDPPIMHGTEGSNDPKIHCTARKNKKLKIKRKDKKTTYRDSKKTAKKSGRGPQYKDKARKQAIRQRKLYYMLSKVSGSEEQDSLWQMTKDIIRMKASFAAAKTAQYLGAILLSLSGIVFLTAFPVVLIVALLYCSPIAAFMENPSGDTPSIQEVLGEYYMEFNQAVSANAGENGAVAYLHEKDGNYVSNYMDTLMVYMVRYGTGDLGVVMDEKHKRLLKIVFDEMNRFEDQTVTTTVQAGQSLGNVLTSAYCSCSICCGQWAGGPAASGAMPKADHTIAVDAKDPFVPMGTRIIMGGKEYVVEDTGAFARYGVQFDIYFDSHSAASGWGHRTMEAFLAEGNENTVPVTKRGSYVKNLNFEDYIALGKLNREQEELLREVMSEGFRSEIPSSGTGSDVANLALTKVGCQYSQERRYEEGYYDCSSLVQRCYAQFGVSLPAIASTQGKYMVDHGLEVTGDMLEPGDVIFYSYENNGQYRNISHVAIYTGNGRMVHASSPERGVVNDPFSPSNIGLYGRPGRGK